MNNKKILNSFLLVITAFIWGLAFVAQKSGAETVGTYCFTFIRSYIAFIALIPVILISDNIRRKKGKYNKCSRKPLLIGGTACGTVLFAATALQQAGFSYGADAGKSGFITALYIIFVPIFSIFLKKKTGIRIWLSAAIAVLGLYLLCVSDSMTISTCDFFTLGCAVVFAVHILIIDHFSPQVNGIKMACIQFFVCGTLSLIFMLITKEKNSFEAVINSYIPVLYLGIMSSGIAYTLQIVAQKEINPSVASIIMSLESVFAVLAGMFFGENLTLRECAGCIIMFVAIILAQIPQKSKMPTASNNK